MCRKTKCVQCRNPYYDGLCSCKKIQAEVGSNLYIELKHSIEEASKALLEQLELEKNPSIRILIARVLYRIGKDEFINDIHKLASIDENVKVRKMATAIYTVMQLEKSLNIADINNKF